MVLKQTKRTTLVLVGRETAQDYTELGTDQKYTGYSVCC